MQAGWKGEVVAVAAAIMCGWIAFYVVPLPSDTITDWPAWVQAIGSVGALIWGVELYRRQSVERRREVVERRADAAIVIVDMIGFATDQIEGVLALLERSDTKAGAFSKVTFDRLAMADEVLSNAPMAQAGDNEILHAVLTMRTRLSQTRRRCEEQNFALGRDAPYDPTATLNDVRRQVRLLYARCSSEHVELRGRFPSAHERVGALKRPLVGLSKVVR